MCGIYFWNWETASLFIVQRVEHFYLYIIALLLVFKFNIYIVLSLGRCSEEFGRGPLVIKLRSSPLK